MEHFMDKLDQGTATVEEIDNYVKTWREGDQKESLQEFLGMTSLEYEVWEEQGNSALPGILSCMKRIAEIVDQCEKLPANGYLKVKDYGPKEYELNIYKDEDFNPKADKDAYNMVDIITEKAGTPVDDALCIHVTDNSLYGELERIWYSKDMSLLP